MAKAGRVPHIRPKQSFRENAQRVVETRLTELLSWRHALGDPTEVQALHDMRIAAKRLRYALEIFEDCFPDARSLLKDLTKMQEDLGDIHDLDVLVGIMEQRLHSYSTPITQQAIEIAEGAANRSDQMNRLRAVLYAHARDRRRLGMLALIGEEVVERRKRYDSFAKRWRGDRLDEFEERVLLATGLKQPEAPVNPDIEERQPDVPVTPDIEESQAEAPVSAGTGEMHLGLQPNPDTGE